MNSGNIALVTIFVLAGFTGFEVISKVSSTLHTPLMSGANAIHGVILIGSMLLLGTASGGTEIGLGVAAVVLATINAVGGFVVTDRMLEMFKGRNAAAKGRAGSSGGPGREPGRGSGGVPR